MGRMFADFEWIDVQAKRREIRDQIRAEVSDEARAEGLAEGKDIHLIQLICKKLAKGQDAVRIADDLMEDLDKVSEICEVANEFAPNYDPEEIYRKMHGTKTEVVMA